jgi:hypothetical protein
MKLIIVFLALTVFSHAQEWNPYNPTVTVSADTKDPFESGMLEGARLMTLSDKVKLDRVMVELYDVLVEHNPDNIDNHNGHIYWLMRLLSDEFDTLEPYNPRTVMLEEPPEWPTDEPYIPVLKIRIGAASDVRL